MPRPVRLLAQAWLLCLLAPAVVLLQRVVPVLAVLLGAVLVMGVHVGLVVAWARRHRLPARG